MKKFKIVFGSLVFFGLALTALYFTQFYEPKTITVTNDVHTVSTVDKLDTYTEGWYASSTEKFEKMHQDYARTKAIEQLEAELQKEKDGMRKEALSFQ